MTPPISTGREFVRHFFKTIADQVDKFANGIPVSERKDMTDDFWQTFSEKFDEVFSADNIRGIFV